MFSRFAHAVTRRSQGRLDQLQEIQPQLMLNIFAAVLDFYTQELKELLVRSTTIFNIAHERSRKKDYK